MKEISCVQGSPEWWAARAGIATASEFGRIITPAKAQLAAGRTSYQAELIAESLGWRRDEFLGSPDIERGHALESDARAWLAFEIGADVREVGFCLADDGRYGCSPDGLVGEIPVELKAPDVHTLVGYHIDGGGLPARYRAQVHGHMLVTGADHCWFCAYSETPQLANILVRVDRDEFTEKLADCVEQFCQELDALKARILLRLVRGIDL